MVAPVGQRGEPLKPTLAPGCQPEGATTDRASQRTLTGTH